MSDGEHMLFLLLPLLPPLQLSLIAQQFTLIHYLIVSVHIICTLINLKLTKIILSTYPADEVQVIAGGRGVRAKSQLACSAHLRLNVPTSWLH